ncbi:MAG: hypothetical protein DHS20C01_01750 [marine bacterium B5-7]|nr:MAG: hypothetical protein DHS20C01_01750 [marine bacterium B5-7]
MVLLGISMAVLVPNIRIFDDSDNMAGFAGTLASDLRRMRTRAITTRMETVAEFDLSNRHYRIADLDDERHFPDGVIVKLKTARSEVTGEHVAGLKFFPDGSSTGGSVVISAPNFHREVQVDWLSGRVAVRNEPGADRNSH